MTKQQCEQLQEDMITYLDGWDDELIDKLCDVIVAYYKKNEDRD